VVESEGANRWLKHERRHTVPVHTHTSFLRLVPGVPSLEQHAGGLAAKMIQSATSTGRSQGDIGNFITTNVCTPTKSVFEQDLERPRAQCKRAQTQAFFDVVTLGIQPRAGGLESGYKTPCRMTGVSLHGVVSSE